MAVLIYPNGKQERVRPQNGNTFTIFEISQILNGLVDILFIGDKWIFSNKTAFRRDMKYNEKVSLLFDYPICGPCLICSDSDNELPSQFLLIDKNESDEMEEIYASNNLKKDSSIKDSSIEEFKDIEDALNEAYYLLFETGKELSEIPNNFIVYRKGNKIFDVSNDPKGQHKILNDMLELFTQNEEYERCSKIVKLLDYLS